MVSNGIVGGHGFDYSQHLYTPCYLDVRSHTHDHDVYSIAYAYSSGENMVDYNLNDPSRQQRWQIDSS